MEKELVIQKDWCKSCGICVSYCPKSVLELDTDGVYIKEDSNCIYCGLCELRCPDFAIYIKEK